MGTELATREPTKTAPCIDNMRGLWVKRSYKLNTSIMKKVNTWLPVFPGYYNTIFECDNEEDIIQSYNEENETDFNYDDFIWNYDNYHKSVSTKATECIKELLKEHNIVRSLEFEGLHSPKYYNYSNDSINIEVTPNKSNILKILRENKSEFEDYIKEKYTSCDGFISRYSNDYRDWLISIQKWEFKNIDHQIGSILQFICEILLDDKDSHEWLYNEIFDGECFEPEYTVI